MTDGTSAQPPRRATEPLGPAPERAGELRERSAAGTFASPRVQEWRTQFTRIEDDLIDVLLSRSVSSSPTSCWSAPCRGAETRKQAPRANGTATR
jgi:hypothetical protein